jgi:hypothetical protein
VTRRDGADIAAEWIRGAFGWIMIAGIAILALPIVVVAVVGFVQRTVPDSDAGGILGVGPGYPVFTPPLWLLIVPALGALALAVWTWRYPGQFMDSIFSARWDLGIVSFVGATTTLGAAVMFGAPFVGILLITAGVWVLALLTVLSRGVWDFFADAAAALRPSRDAPTSSRRRPATASTAPAPVPALRIAADGAQWQRSKQRLTLQDGDPRRLTVDVYDSATNDLGLARALVRAVDGDGEDAAPPVSTSFTGGIGTAVRTVRAIRSRHGERLTATWHWDDGERAVLMVVFDVEPDRFAAAEPALDRLASGIHIGSA